MQQTKVLCFKRVLKAPQKLVCFILGFQRVVLFREVVEPLGGIASPDEVGHQGDSRSFTTAELPVHSLLPDCGGDVTRCLLLMLP